MPSTTNEVDGPSNLLGIKYNKILNLGIKYTKSGRPCVRLIKSSDFAISCSCDKHAGICAMKTYFYRSAKIAVQMSAFSKRNTRR